MQSDIVTTEKRHEVSQSLWIDRPNAFAYRDKSARLPVLFFAKETHWFSFDIEKVSCSTGPPWKDINVLVSSSRSSRALLASDAPALHKNVGVLGLCQEWP